MLIEFSITNYGSIKNRQTFSMVADTLKNNKKENTFEACKEPLLKNAIIYGTNASGKTKIAKALKFVQEFVRYSFNKYENNKGIKDIDPFLLNIKTKDQPSEFEIVFCLNEKIYKYTLIVEEKGVVLEKLEDITKTKEVVIFERKKQKIKLNEKIKFLNFDKAEEATRTNVSFIWTADRENLEIAQNIKNYFKNLVVLVGDSHPSKTLNMLENDDEFKIFLKSILKKCDTGILDITATKEIIKLKDILEDKKIPEFIKEQCKEQGKNLETMKIRTQHNVYEENEIVGQTNFSFPQQESKGTRSIFELAGYVYLAFKNQGVLFIDEFDSIIHPKLVKDVFIPLFNEQNNNKAQIVFITHNTNLLGCETLRRDQFWFVEKNNKGESSLFSLSDFRGEDKNKERNDSKTLEKKYLEGRYGAVPIIQSI